MFFWQLSLCTTGRNTLFFVRFNVRNELTLTYKKGIECSPFDHFDLADFFIHTKKYREVS